MPGRAENADVDANPFAATVTVDATAETVVKAREMARIDGQRRALAAVVERLAGGSAPRPSWQCSTTRPSPTCVASFEVANGAAVPAVRYVADYTFHFRAAEVRRVLGNAGVRRRRASR